MLILADTNLVIQLYFIIGDRAIRHARAPRLEIHKWVRTELTGICRNKKHLTTHESAILGAFPVTMLTSPAVTLSREISYLEAQYDTIRSKGGSRLGAAPSNIDYTHLALASLHGCGLATLEHTLLALALDTLRPEQVMTLEPLIKLYLSSGTITEAAVVAAAAAMPREENLRRDDARYIRSLKGASLEQPTEQPISKSTGRKQPKDTPPNES